MLASWDWRGSVVFRAYVSLLCRYASTSSFLHHIPVWEHRECWWEPEQIWLNESGRTVLELIDGFRWTIAPPPRPLWCSARPLPPQHAVTPAASTSVRRAVSLACQTLAGGASAAAGGDARVLIQFWSFRPWWGGGHRCLPVSPSSLPLGASSGGSGCYFPASFSVPGGSGRRGSRWWGCGGAGVYSGPPMMDA